MSRRGIGVRTHELRMLTTPWQLEDRHLQFHLKSEICVFPECFYEERPHCCWVLQYLWLFSPNTTSLPDHLGVWHPCKQSNRMLLWGNSGFVYFLTTATNLEESEESVASCLIITRFNSAPPTHSDSCWRFDFLSQYLNQSYVIWALMPRWFKYTIIPFCFHNRLATFNDLHKLTSLRWLFLCVKKSDYYIYS